MVSFGRVFANALAVRGPIKFGADGPVLIEGSGFPASGTAGDGAGHAPVGSIYMDVTRGTLWFNDGSQASPYWQPISYDQPEMWGVHTDFRDQVGKAVADTAAEAVLAGSGLRVFGQGIAETDSGLVAQAAAEGGIVGRMTATNQDGHLVAIGMDGGIYQPDQHGMAIVEAELAHVSAITLRAQGIGFVGTAADALDPPVTGDTVTSTLVQDDAGGMFFDADFTDADRIYAFHNKSNEAASQDATAGGRDTSTNIPAAGTYQLQRVEVEPSGSAVIMRCFLDKVLVATIDDALDEDEEASPVLWLESTSTAVKSMDVRRFAAIMGRA